MRPTYNAFCVAYYALDFPSARAKYKALNIKAQVLPFLKNKCRFFRDYQMEQSVVRASVGNDDVQTAGFKYTLNFFEHFGSVQETFVATQNGVKSAFLDYHVIAFVTELAHLQSVCHESLHEAALPVHLGHLLDTHLRDIDVVDIVPAVIVHVATHHRVPASELHDLRIFWNQVVYNRLEACEVLQPVEGFS